MKYIALIIITLFMLCSCEESTNTSPKKKFAMISSIGGFDDNGFNMLGKKGLMNLAEKYDIEIVFRESKSTSEIESNIDEFAKGSTDFIFALGYDMAPAISKLSPFYFNKYFSIIDYKFTDVFKNVSSASFKVEEACYPLGYLAAYFANSKTPDIAKVAFIGGQEAESILDFLNGFQKGIEYYNISNTPVTLITQYVGSYVDSAKAYQMTVELISQGVTVFFPPSGVSGRGCFQAVKEANLFAIGYDNDCYVSLPEYKNIFLSSCIKRIDNAVYEIGEYFIKNNVNKPENYLGNLINEGVVVAPYHDFDTKIPESVKSTILYMIDDIKSGRIIL